jgi:hypothetical protein
MAVQKKNTKKNPTKSGKFTWTQKRKNAAFLLSIGGKNHQQIADEVGINRDTLFEWKKREEFLEEVDRLTLKNENFTRAGLLKNCLGGLRIKERYIDDDKNTYLDYIKEIAELQGFVKQKIDLDNKHSGKVEVVLTVEDFGADDED